MIPRTCSIAKTPVGPPTGMPARSRTAHTLVLCPMDPRKLLGCRSSGMKLHPAHGLLGQRPRSFAAGGGGSRSRSVLSRTRTLQCRENVMRRCSAVAAGMRTHLMHRAGTGKHDMQ